MKTFTIELHAYPQEFIISAETEAEAIMKATERFGMSVFESKVLEVKELELCERCHLNEITRNGHCTSCHQAVFGV